MPTTKVDTTRATVEWPAEAMPASRVRGATSAHVAGCRHTTGTGPHAEHQAPKPFFRCRQQLCCEPLVAHDLSRSSLLPFICMCSTLLPIFFIQFHTISYNTL